MPTNKTIFLNTSHILITMNVHCYPPWEGRILEQFSQWGTASVPDCLRVISTFVVALGFLASPLRAQFVYVSNLTSNDANSTVLAYDIDPNEALSPIPGKHQKAGDFTSSMVVDPTGHFLFGVNQYGGTISAFSIASDGALKPVPKKHFNTGYNPTSVAVTPNSQFLFVANWGDDTVSAYSIESNGNLTPVPGSPFAAGTGPFAVVIDPTGQFVYVTNLNGASISAYTIGQNGALTPVPGSPFPFTIGPMEPYSLVTDPTGQFLFVGDINDGYILPYSIGPNGALTPLPQSPNLLGNKSMVVTGHFLYGLSGVVSGYIIGSGGSLTNVLWKGFEVGRGPTSMAIDSTGRFVFVVSQFSADVHIFAIGSNGMLTPVAGSPFKTIKDSFEIAISP
jgi:6-phosphogluconolactonase